MFTCSLFRFCGVGSTALRLDSAFAQVTLFSSALCSPRQCDPLQFLPVMTNHFLSSSSSSSSPSPSSSSLAASIVRASETPRSRRQARKLNRARHYSVRLSREAQIPALAAHCGQFGESNLRGKLWRLFEQELAAEMGLAASSSSARTPSGKLMSPLGKSNAQNGIVGVCLSDCSSRDGDVSDMGSECSVFDLRNWKEGTPCSPFSIYEVPINETRMASICPSDRDSNYFFVTKEISTDSKSGSAENWKLHAEVLMAECNLLRVEKELAFRRWRYCCADSNLPFLSMESKEGDRSQGKAGCVHPRSDLISENELKRMKPQDPADVLQPRLRKLSLAASGPKFASPWNPIEHGASMSVSNNTFDAEKCPIQRLDALSLELSEPNSAAVSLSKKYRGMLSAEDGEFGDPHTPQVIAEETYCKAAIQKIATQMLAEAEQWSEMKGILHNLQEEMETLNRACEMWKERALSAEAQVISLREMICESRSRAERAEQRASLIEEETHNLKNKLRKMKQQNVRECSHWIDYKLAESLKHNVVVPFSALSSEQGKCTFWDEEDKPRHASVGTQEDYTPYESIVHSRNDSWASSFDMGNTIMNHKCSSNKSIKKARDLAVSGVKLGPKSHRLSEQSLKAEAAKLDVCQSANDVKSSLTSKNFECARLERIEALPSIRHENTKKAKHFMGMEENTLYIAAGDRRGKQLKDGRWMMTVKEELGGPLNTGRLSRPPFGDIQNACIPEQGDGFASIVH